MVIMWTFGWVSEVLIMRLVNVGEESDMVDDLDLAGWRVLGSSEILDMAFNCFADCTGFYMKRKRGVLSFRQFSKFFSCR